MKRIICKLMHGSDSMAFAGGSTYECRRCGTEFPVPWAKFSERAVQQSSNPLTRFEAAVEGHRPQGKSAVGVGG